MYSPYCYLFLVKSSKKTSLYLSQENKHAVIRFLPRRIFFFSLKIKKYIEEKFEQNIWKMVTFCQKYKRNNIFEELQIQLHPMTVPVFVLSNSATQIQCEVAPVKESPKLCSYTPWLLLPMVLISIRISHPEIAGIRPKWAIN